MQVHPRRALLAVIISAGAFAAGPAVAHQTVSNAGTSVTFHATPEDEPVAGQPSTLTIVAVRPKGRRSTFSFKRCGCRIKITDSSGRTLRDAPAGKRTTFTFPDAAAYQVVVSGRYRDARKKTRRFSATFALRATTNS